MLKNIIATSLVAIALMFSGCGSTDANGSDKLSSQNAIDGGNYGSAIASLSAKPAAQRTDDENLLLASAYMGRAGFSLTDIIVTVQDASEDDTAGTDDLESFKNSVIGDGLTADELQAKLDDIDLAIEAYEAIEGATTITSAPSLADTPSAEDLGVSDTQLKLGLAYIIKLMILLDGDSPSSSDLATLANKAFDYILKVAPDDVTTNIQDVKSDVDTDASGVITATEIDVLLLRL